MQQNVRVAINRMMREIRMAGFGGKNENTNGNNDIINVFGAVNGFANIINPVNDTIVDGINHDQITVIGAFRQIGILAAAANAGDNTLNINYIGNTKFDTDKKKYTCINGRYNYEVDTAKPPITLAKTLKNPLGTLNESHLAGEPVYLVEAITYGLEKDPNGTPVLFRDSNTGGGNQDVAENIEDLQFRYVLADTTEVDVPANPQDVRGVRITVRATTRMSDPQLKEGGGFRKRTLNTYVDLRNLRD